MIFIYQINKWAFQWKMSFNPDPSKQAQKSFLVEKVRRFLILHYVLITALLKPISKTLREVSCCLINIWGTLEINYYHGKQSYRTVVKIAKNSAEAEVNNYVQSFSETTFRLWRHNLWWSLQQKISPESLVYSMQCLLDLLRGIRGLSREKLYH